MSEQSEGTEIRFEWRGEATRNGSGGGLVIEPLKRGWFGSCPPSVPLADTQARAGCLSLQTKVRAETLYEVFGVRYEKSGEFEFAPQGYYDVDGNLVITGVSLVFKRS